jgi:hypothetical protein
MSLERSTVSRNNVVSKSLRDAPMKLLCGSFRNCRGAGSQGVNRIHAVRINDKELHSGGGTFRYMIVDVRVREAISYHQQSRGRLTNCPSKLLLAPTEKRRRCNIGVPRLLPPA